MTIEADVGKSTVTLTLSGRLDTANAPQLERKIKQWGDDIVELILDFSDLSYISSMGLRVLLQTQKAMKEKQRRLVIRNMGEAVREVFELTGFINLIVQEEKFVVVRKDEDDCIVLLFNGKMEVENVPAVSEELTKIKTQNTHTSIAKELGMSKKLTELMEQTDTVTDPVNVVMDMEKLTRISAGALRQFKNVIDETAWNNRNLTVRNVSDDIQALFTIEGIL